MAIIYGTSTGISASAYSIWLECITNSQSIAGNTSNVTVNFKCQRIDSSDGGYSFFAPNVNFAGLVVNGTTIYATNHDTGNVDLTNHRLETFDTWTGDIAHNADGTKSLALSASWYNTQSSYLSGGSVSGSVSLATIPRASSVSLGNFVIGDTAIPITITRASSTFTHTLSYKFAADSGYTQFATSVGNYLAWNTSGLVATLNGKIPSSLSGTMIIKCDTYSGGTLIGTAYSTPVTGSVNTTAYKPNISATVIDVGVATTPLTDSDNKIVKYKSTAKITPTASGWHGATIFSITMTMGSKHYTSATVPAYYNLVDVDSHIAVVSVTDSRGLTNSVTVTKTLVNYSLVSIGTADFKRTTPVGTVVGLTLAGSWWNGNFGTLANVLTIKYKYRQLPSGNYGSDVILSNGITNYTLAEVFNNLYAYEFTITVSDRLSSVAIVKTISSGTPIMDIGENDIKINGAFTIKANSLATAATNYYVDTGDGVLKQKTLAAAKAELYTAPSASALLTSIKTVDGAGSGLDADTVDGTHLSSLLTTGAWTASGNHEFYSSSNNYASAPVEIREVGLVSTAQSSESYAPSLAFHWGGRTEGSIYMTSTGVLKWGDPTTGKDIWHSGLVNFATGRGTYNSSAWVAVSFGKTFPGIPRVQLTPNSTVVGVLAPKVKNVSTTGFEAVMGGSVGTVVCDWVAIWA